MFVICINDSILGLLLKIKDEIIRCYVVLVWYKFCNYIFIVTFCYRVFIYMRRFLRIWFFEFIRVLDFNYITFIENFFFRLENFFFILLSFLWLGDFFVFWELEFFNYINRKLFREIIEAFGNYRLVFFNGLKVLEYYKKC